MDLKGHKHSLYIAIACFAIALVAYLLMGCAHNFISTNCSDESIVAAQTYHRRTGRPTYIAKSADGTHAQAFTIKNGRRVWLYIYPRYQWAIYETDTSDDFANTSDDFIGGIGHIYTVDEFLWVHRNSWRVK